MAIKIENNTLIFESVIYEDEVNTMRDFFQEKAPENITIDFSNCEDIHLSILQTIMAYKKLYQCEYQFSDEKKIFQKVLQGFDTSENHCN
jgi:ssDNA-specific exonuclease RecJ